MKKGFFAIASVLLYLVSVLPFRMLYLLSDIVYFALYYLVQYRRQVVSTNLQNAFPEKTAAQRLKIEKQFYSFLADQILETIKMRSMSPAQIRRRFRLNNLEEVQKHFRNGRSVLGATGHYGNWEWGTHIISLTIPEPVIVVYKPLADKDFEAYTNRIRARFGAVLVSMKLTIRKIIAYKHTTFMALFVSDQTPVAGETQYFTTFLNQPTAVFLGVEKIARSTDYPVVYCHINRLKRGYYECTFKTLTAHPAQAAEHEITEAHTHELERIIREKPELWLWSHRRWKFKPEDIKK